MKHKIVLLALTTLFLSACNPKLKEQRLPVALLNQDYSYTFEVDSNGTSFDTYVTQLSGGHLPDDIDVSANGVLDGIPTELGIFDFEVRVIFFDEGSFFDSEDTVYHSESDFKLIVTEPSTNADCPSPDSLTVTGIYICLGDVEDADGLTTGDTFDLDVTGFIDFNEAPNYKVNGYVFTITYDSTLFSLDTDTLNSAILREASDWASASVSFDTSTAGTLVVTLTANDDEHFDPSGRLMDIPFTAVTDIATGVTSDFGLSISSVTSEDSASLPTPFTVSGQLIVGE